MPPFIQERRDNLVAGKFVPDIRAIAPAGEGAARFARFFPHKLMRLGKGRLTILAEKA